MYVVSSLVEILTTLFAVVANCNTMKVAWFAGYESLQIFYQPVKPPPLHPSREIPGARVRRPLLGQLGRWICLPKTMLC
jgi:hypothetical protein